MDFLPVTDLGLLSSDFTMNVQACSRCGYGVYPAEKINCLDQVSRHFLAFANCHKLGKYILSHMDVGFSEPPRYNVFPTLLQFYQFLATSPVLSQKFVAEYEFYHHFIPKAHFFFALKYMIPENERKGNFAQSFLFGF